MSTVLRSARSRPSWVVLALVSVGLMGAVMVMTSTTAPSMAQTYPCNPGTVFGVGPNGIYEVRPYVPSSRLIKGMSGGKAISAGFDDATLYVTINNALWEFDLSRLTLDPVGLNVPADHNGLSEGYDGYLYLSTASGELHQIDVGVSPPTIAKIGASQGYTGDLAMDPSAAGSALTWLRGARVRAAGGSQLVWVDKLNGYQHPIGVFHDSSGVALPLPMEGLAHDQAASFFGSDTSTLLNESLWYVNPTTAQSLFAMSFEYHITDMASEPSGFCATPTPEPTPFALGDLGDAPDSSNNVPNRPMTTYGGVPADFPTVFTWWTGLAQGPKHFSQGDAVLGTSGTQEFDADVMPDTDGMTNLDPSIMVDDRDGGDDGLASPIGLPHCQTTTADFSVDVAGAAQPRYVSIWFDFNRDGDWRDTLNCIDPISGQNQVVPERVVFNYAFSVGQGTHTLTTPAFRAFDPAPGGNIWMRATLTSHEIVSTDGRGPRSGYSSGETEDYYLTHSQGSVYFP